MQRRGNTITLSYLIFLLSHFTLAAQVPYLSPPSDPALDSIKPCVMALSWQGESFFYNNEFNSSLYTGYTLPGYRLSMTVDHRMDVLHGAGLSFGLQSLQYWGASRYPSAVAYRDVGYWSDDKSCRGIRLRPFFRAELKPTSQSILVLGNLYGGTAHKLIEPLYNQELALTADPETGIQYRYTGDRFESDLWIDWQSFIYKRDDHQEAFAAGLRSQWTVVKDYTADSLRLNLPIQILAAHRGGEYNLTQDDTVHTWINGAIGLEFIRNIPHFGGLKLSAAAYLLGYSQRSKHYPLDKGYGLFADLHASKPYLDLGLSYWQAKNWVAPYGQPFANGLDKDARPLAGGRSSYINGYARLHYHLSPNLSVGGIATVWLHPHAPRSGFSHSLGVYLAIRPSVVLIR